MSFNTFNSMSQNLAISNDVNGPLTYLLFGQDNSRYLERYPWALDQTFRQNITQYLELFSLSCAWEFKLARFNCIMYID